MNRLRVESVCAAAVFGATFFASLVFIHFYPPPPPANDAVEYFRIARNLAAGKGFSFDGVHPYVYRPPLFAFLLGMWFRLAGASVLSAAVFQCLMHGLSAAAAYLLFRSLRCPTGWAIVLSLGVALQPTLLTATAFVMQEPTLLLFTTSALLATAIWLRGRSAGWACVAGFSWGIVTLGKAVTLFVLPLVLVYRLACGEEARGSAFRQAALFSLFFLVTLVPWTARNYLQFHRVIPVNDQVVGVLEWNVSHATPAEGPDGETFVSDLDHRGITGERRMESLRQYVGEGWRYFFIERVFRNAVSFASPARDWWWARGRYGPGESRPWYWTLHDYFYRLLFMALLFRTFQAARGRLSAGFGFVALFCMTYWAEHALILGIPRFSLPIYPALLAMLIPNGGCSANPEGRGELRSFMSPGRNT